jgi:hypothetical protein
MMKRYEFTAHGKYPFPTDMLRYDACYPLGPGDVSKIQEGIVGPSVDQPFRDRPVLKIRLVSYLHAPTEDRWRSFGWFVEGLDERKVS